MEKFQNITSNNKEKAIKIGNSVPDDGVPISWFSTKEISPKNNIVTLDLSETIPENTPTSISDNEAFFAVSEELGFLKTVDNKFSFSTDQLTISNIPLHRQMGTDYYDVLNENPNEFAHYYYISRYFAPAPSNFFYTGLDQYLDPDRLGNLKLKVLDSNGLEYVDQNTGRKKYRILLEPFVTETNRLRYETPHRVIVLLDASEPVSLKLNYDKVESDQDGNMFHLELNYLETINALPIFKEIPEEAFVIDPNYIRSKQFSIKKINQKYSDLIENAKLDTGYQIIAPGKPVDDNRTFEAFNWRLIARTNRNVNLVEINDEIGSLLINKTIKAGIIYSSNSNQSNSTIYPYVFRRLQDSPFNLSQFNFINPLQEPGYGGTGSFSKDDSEYWKVDIDSVNNFDNFDILLWSPDATISQTQALKLNSFISKNGTLLVDLSYLSVNATALNPQLSMSLNRVDSNYEFTPGLASTLYSSVDNGGWAIEFGIFEKPEYGIYGSRYNFNSSTYKQYYYFNDVPDSNNVLSLGSSEDGTDSQPVCLHIKSLPEADALVGGNLIGLTTRLMSYCNSIYSISSPEQVIDSNVADTYADVNENNYYSSVLEGPFKFLYNIVSYTAYCRLQASRETRTNSSLYNFVTNWNSSWVMDSSVLWQDEIDEFYTPISISGGVDLYGRKLSNSTIIDFYKDQFSNFMMSHHQDIAFGDLTDTELFIECTNDDVIFSNAEKVLSSDVNINSSYNLYSVLNNSEAVYAYATTAKSSPALTVPEGIGPYTILDKQYSSSNSPLLRNELNILSNFRSYPFSLQTKYTYLTATDKPSIIDANFTPTLKMLFKGTLTEQRTITIDEPPTTQLVDATLNCQNFKSAIDDLGLLRETVSSKPGNIFLYSGDIDIHKDTRLWKNGSPQHEYVKYIQYTVSAANNSAIKIDGIYGSQTAGAVRQFQVANNERYLDGTVDSETKSYMARYWKALKSTNLTKYNQLRTATINNANLSVVTKYIDATDKIGLTSDINTKTYKKLTFSGFSGPGEGMDILYFKIPNTVKKVNKIIIEADSNQIWRNFSIVQVGYSSAYSSDIFKYTVKAVNKTAATGTIEIPMNNIAGENARYLWIHVIGNSLTGYGYAEGFSIKSIKVFGKVSVTIDPDPETSEETFTSDIYALATVDLEDVFQGVSPSQTKIKQYTTSSFPRLGGSITALTIDANLDGSISGVNILPNGPVAIDSALLEDLSLIDNSNSLFLNNKVKINFSNPPILILADSISIDSFTNNGLEITDGSPIEINYSNAADNKSVTLTAQTSSTYYSDAVFLQDGPELLSNYRLQKPSGTPFPGTRNAVTAADGIMLLCNSSGGPVGILDTLDIQNGVSGLTSPELEEVNTSLGDFSVINSIGDQDGFMYGFYDRNRLEFIGKTISYTELISRGVNNVFVSVCAYDADGNTQNQSEYIGPVSDTRFIAPRIPLKTIYPIYSVKLRRASSIRVDKIDQNISKFDIWNLPISSGSFWKDISIVYRPWVDWKSDYIGQTLKAFYTTFDDLTELGSTGFESTGTVWSEIYGYGHYDIKDESPVILDDRTIQLRKTPLLKVAYPTSNLSSDTGVIKYELHVFTRATTASSWIEVSDDLIKDVDSITGIIKFRTRMVPSDKNLIKVNYVTANKNRMIHQLNGEMIPLNPLFSSLMTFDNGSKATFDAPLYIYLKPKAIYKQQLLSGATNVTDVNLVKIDEYTCDKTIGFTYNSAIFNRNVAEYDPFALPIAIIYVTNNPYKIEPSLYDIRVRGGGVDVDVPTSTLIESVPEVLSNWDVYPPSGMAYAKGGYVIIQIPASVKDHFLDEKEIYQIISNNLTAGVVYELQDMDGNSWN